MTRMPNNYNSKECDAFAYRQWDMRCSQRDSENTYSWRKQRSRNSSPCCTDRRRERLARCSCLRGSCRAKARESRVNSKVLSRGMSERIIDDDSLTLCIRRSHLHLQICPHRTPRTRTLGYCSSCRQHTLSSFAMKRC